MESESTRTDYLKWSGMYPEWDEFCLVVCEHCGTIIRPQAYEKHLKTKHQTGVQTAPTTPTSNNTTPVVAATNKLQPKLQKQQQIPLPGRKHLDQHKQQQAQPNSNQLQVQQQPPQKITINPPPPTIDRKPTITARTTITTIPNIKPRTITATTAIKTTTNSQTNNIANGSSVSGDGSNHVLKSSKPVKRAAPAANNSTTNTTNNKQSNNNNNLQPAATIGPTPAKTKPKAKTKAVSTNSKTQQQQANTANVNGKVSTSKNSKASSSNSTAPQQPPLAPQLPSRDDFFDPSFYGLEPLSPPSSAIGGPLSSSSSASSTSSSASCSSSSGSSTNSSLSYCTSLSNHNHHRNVISLPLNGSGNQLPPAFLSKYQDRKWRNTYNVLRDAFF